MRTLSSTAVMPALLAAFGFSLFFDGYGNINYAPAVLLLLTGALLIILPGLRGGLFLPSSGTALALFAFWFYATASLSWSTVPFVSLITYLILITLPLMFLMFSVRESLRNWLRPAALGLIAALTLLGGWAVCQTLFLSDVYGPRAHHPLLNSDNLAILLDLGLLMALAFLMTADNRKTALGLWLPATLIIFGGLIATGSRAALICFVIGGVALAVMLRPQVKMNGRRILLTLLLMAVVFAGVETGSSAGMAGRMASLAAPAQDAAVVARVATWKSAFAMFAEHPLTGTGLGTFYLYYPAHRALADQSSAGYWAHMDPLQYAVEMGALAPALFYIFLSAVLLRTRAALRAVPADDPRRLWIAGPFCALLALAVHIHTSFDLYLMPVLIVAGVWLAAWHEATAEVLPARRSYSALALPSFGKVFFGATSLAAAALIALMAVSSAMGIHYLGEARTALTQGKGSRFLPLLAHAEQVAPASFIDPKVQRAGFYIDLLNSAGVLSEAEWKTFFNEALDLLAQAQSLNPAWAEIDYKRAQLYLAATDKLAPGGKDKAFDSLKKALAKDPMLVRARTNLVTLYVGSGRAEEAFSLLAAGLKWPHSAQTAAQYQSMMEQLRPLVEAQRRYRDGKGP